MNSFKQIGNAIIRDIQSCDKYLDVYNNPSKKDKGKKMNRNIEFMQNYYDWIVKCLRLDNKLDVLAFFMLGCEIGVRKKELVSITWEQIEFPYINNVKILKMRDGKEPDYYPPLKISDKTETAIHIGCTDKEEELFPKPIMWYVAQIRQSCGDNGFSGSDMRRIAIVNKLAQFKENI